jgi:hypothetical protein
VIAVADATKKHTQHGRSDEANAPQVHDYVSAASAQRLVECLFELRGVRPVEFSIEDEHPRLLSGWLGS